MKIFEKLTNLFAAVAFAEEGDAETARQLAAEDDEGAAGGHVPRARPASRPAPRADVPMTGRSRA
jgi:hypothetical protein